MNEDQEAIRRTVAAIRTELSEIISILPAGHRNPERLHAIAGEVHHLSHVLLDAIRATF